MCYETQLEKSDICKVQYIYIYIYTNLKMRYQKEQALVYVYNERTHAEWNFHFHGYCFWLKLPVSDGSNDKFFKVWSGL